MNRALLLTDVVGGTKLAERGALSTDRADEVPAGLWGLQVSDFRP